MIALAGVALASALRVPLRWHLQLADAVAGHLVVLVGDEVLLMPLALAMTMRVD